MPHAVIDYSANLTDAFHRTDVSALVHQALIGTGVFDADNLKTRAYVADDFHVGVAGRDGSFVHLVVYLLEGRTLEQKQQLSKVALTVMRNALPQAGQISVDIRDMVKDTYQKYRGA